MERCDWKCLTVRVGSVNNFAFTNASVSVNLVLLNDLCAVQATGTGWVSNGSLMVLDSIMMPAVRGCS